jgi:hypothetical protein
VGVVSVAVAGAKSNCSTKSILVTFVLLLGGTSPRVDIRRDSRRVADEATLSEPTGTLGGMAGIGSVPVSSVSSAPGCSPSRTPQNDELLAFRVVINGYTGAIAGGYPKSWIKITWPYSRTFGRYGALLGYTLG